MREAARAPDDHGWVIGHAGLGPRRVGPLRQPPASPPFFVWHTAEDPYVPPEHTYRFASALAASGVPHAVHVFVFAHGPHSLGLARGAGEAVIWTTMANAWIHEQAARDHIIDIP